MYRTVYTRPGARSGCISFAVGMESRPMSAERLEHELLRLCVRRRLAKADSAAIHTLLGRELDWSYLVATASRQLMLPLLAETLRAESPAAIPPAVMADLASRLEKLHVRNRHLAHELLRLHRLAAAARVTFLSYKGPLLATAVYGDLGLRQFADLDLLVDESSFAESEAFFTAHGYRRVRDFGYEVALVDEQRGVTVDLHRALSPDNFPIATSFPQLWARRSIVPLYGERLETLSTSDLFIALCVEAVKDARQGKVKLGKMSDVAHLAMSGVDWADVDAQARRLGVRRVVAFVIDLVAGVLGLSFAVPPGLAVPHPRLTTFRRDTRMALFAAAPVPPRSVGPLFHFHFRESWRDRLRLHVVRVRRLLTPNALDREVVSLPGWLSPLYYLVRPFRLVRLYGRQLTRILARSQTIA
jgi:hypothetical protein